MAEIFGIVIPFAYLCAALNKCSRAKKQSYLISGEATGFGSSPDYFIRPAKHSAALRANQFVRFVKFVVGKFFCCND